MLCLGVALGIVTSCNPSPSLPASGRAGEALAEQLGFPAWRSGQPCPRSRWQDIGKTGAPEGLGAAGYYTVLGAGPAFPVVYNFDPNAGTLSFSAFITQRGDPIIGRVWSKMRWISAPGIGRAVVRGARLDGGAPVYLDITGGDELVLDPSAESGSWHDHAGGFSVAGPGCYGLRVEGVGWSDVLVLEVVP
jgi:hypothetical protein